VARDPGGPSFPPTIGMEAGHRASRSNRILINRTHPKAMTTTVVLAPKQHRKPGCGEGSKQVGGEDMSGGLEGAGCINLQGEHCALAQGRGGGVGQMHRGPHFFLQSSGPWGCRHLGRSALYCCPPALNTPNPNTSTTGGSGTGRRAGMGKLLRERFN
jgi:hypothetical protein